MDIQESFRRILEQKQAVTHLFFAVALSGCQEAHFVCQGTDWAGQSLEFSSSSQAFCVPLTLYAQFANDLLQALRDFHGPDWTPDLMQQWRMAIERVGRAICSSSQDTAQG